MTFCLKTSAVGVSVGAVIAQTAAATEGYFREGYGTREKGIVGAGAAVSRDRTAVYDDGAGLHSVESGAKRSRPVPYSQRGLYQSN